MFELIIEWLDSHQTQCFFKSNFGIACPGCGAQRSLILLLKGDLLASFKMYPPLSFFIFLILFLIFHLNYKVKNGHLILQFAFTLTSFVVVLNYLKSIL
ncbi:MAG: DUF2752 domain-containing protein [Bacteroidota bacterium]